MEFCVQPAAHLISIYHGILQWCLPSSVEAWVERGLCTVRLAGAYRCCWGGAGTPHSPEEALSKQEMFCSSM